MPPPKVIYDGKTGEAIEVAQDAPNDFLTVYILTMVQLLGFERAAAYLGIDLG